MDSGTVTRVGIVVDLVEVAFDDILIDSHLYHQITLFETKVTDVENSQTGRNIARMFVNVLYLISI